MAIRGAFAAGLLDGFATGLTEGVEKRQDRFDVLFDESLDSAKRLAPKYAKSKAEADAAVEMMNCMVFRSVSFLEHGYTVLLDVQLHRYRYRIFR